VGEEDLLEAGLLFLGVIVAEAFEPADAKAITLD
jgi:hypothetical protein